MVRAARRIACCGSIVAKMATPNPGYGAGSDSWHVEWGGIYEVTDLAVIDGDLWAVGSHIAREREGQWVAVETPRNGVLSALSWDGEHAWAVGNGEIWQYEAGQWGLAQLRSTTSRWCPTAPPWR
jgi:hypothetical protein